MCLTTEQDKLIIPFLLWLQVIHDLPKRKQNMIFKSTFKKDDFNFNTRKMHAHCSSSSIKYVER